MYTSMCTEKTICMYKPTVCPKKCIVRNHYTLLHLDAVIVAHQPLYSGAGIRPTAGSAQLQGPHQQWGWHARHHFEHITDKLLTPGAC
jgi:hypothetical protein